MQCSKDHKVKCPALTNKAPEPTDATTTNDSVATANNEESKYLSQKEIKANQSKRKRRSRSGDESDDSHDDEPGWNITPEMKKRMHQSTWLRKELQDGGLRQLIEQIDAASDDEADDRKKYQRANNNKISTVVSARELALARKKHSHPKFASFIDEMLLTAGVLQPATDGAAAAAAGGGGHDSLMSILEGRGPLVLAPVPRRSGATNTTSEMESESSDSDDSSDSDEDSESDSSEESDGSNNSGKSE